MDLTLTELVLSLLVGSMAMVLIFSLTSKLTRVSMEARSVARRVICRLCLHAFENPEKKSPVHCPHCGAANEKGRNRSLG